MYRATSSTIELNKVKPMLFVFLQAQKPEYMMSNMSIPN